MVCKFNLTNTPILYCRWSWLQEVRTCMCLYILHLWDGADVCSYNMCLHTHLMCSYNHHQLLAILNGEHAASQSVSSYKGTWLYILLWFIEKNSCCWICGKKTDVEHTRSTSRCLWHGYWKMTQNSVCAMNTLTSR